MMHRSLRTAGRMVVRRQPVAWARLAALSGRRPYSDDHITTTSFAGAERAREEQDARKRDQELIKQLRAKLQAQSAENEALKEAVDQDYYDDPLEESAVTLDDFMAFRKEMIGKVRDLEDEVIALRAKVKRR